MEDGITDTDGERNKEYDIMILWCISKNGNSIERGYIVPKTETDLRQAVTIVTNSSRISGWYEQYRLQTKKPLIKLTKYGKDNLKTYLGSYKGITLKKANDIWQIINGQVIYIQTLFIGYVEIL